MRKIYGFIILMLLLGAVSACRQEQSAPNANVAANQTARQTPSPNAPAPNGPTIEISAARTLADGYKIIDSAQVKMTVRAAAPAPEAQIFYQPLTSDDDDQMIKLKTLIPNNQTGDSFETELKTPTDFNGEIWARIRYATGEIKETEHLRVAAAETAQNAGQKPDQQNDHNSKAESATPSDTDESERSDKVTGGHIEHAALKPGDGNVKITVNVPSFVMTFWQDGKEIKSYYVGVGRKSFPIPIGMRSADKIILNPDWIPPDSDWVRKSGLEPYQKIPASSPKNPLGKIKIPLGDAYLLHEAAGPQDRGNLVSHGCVHVLRDDMFDITKLIAAARGLSISPAEIEAARKNTDRKVIDLKGDVPVDINYDTMVVENGVLYLYPDVYQRDTNTVEKLRTELAGDGVETNNYDDKMLKEILDKVDQAHKFVIGLADLKAGNGLKNGRLEPLTPQQARTNKSESIMEKTAN